MHPAPGLCSWRSGRCGPAVGVDVPLAAAEGALVEADPSHRERSMARLGLAATLGVLAVPGLLAALALVGLSWRVGFALSGLTAATLAVVHARSLELDRFPVADDPDSSGPRPSMRETLSTAFRNRPLLVWSLVGAVTSLLDEVLVAFVAVHLDAFGATAFQRSVALALWTVCGLLRLAMLERTADRLDPLRTLATASVVSGIALGVLAATRSPLLATVVLGIVGATSATFHPIAKARAYAALPGRPAIVNALASCLMPLEVAAPIVMGLLATRAGSRFAVAFLLIAPVSVGFAAVAARRLSNRERDPDTHALRGSLRTAAHGVRSNGGQGHHGQVAAIMWSAHSRPRCVESLEGQTKVRKC